MDGLWKFLVSGLRDLHSEHGVTTISVTTHGACVALIDADGGLAAPILDYEHTGPDEVSDAYDAVRPPFSETGSPRLNMGLNVGAQLYWQFESYPELRNRVHRIVTYPQYWGFRLTGVMATDVTSLGSHTDLWNPREGRFSSLVGELGILNKIAPTRKPAEILGPILPNISAQTGLGPETPVLCGIHDSNASLLPHLLRSEHPFVVVSTGTWVICMALGGRDVALDPERDTLINVNAFGEPVPSARFMGGREFEIIRSQGLATPTEADRQRVLERGIMLLPSVEPTSGPFPGQTHDWSEDPGSDGARALALSWYLALMTETCLSLIGAQGQVHIEGPFTLNSEFLEMLEAHGRCVVPSSLSSTGTSAGAAILAGLRRSHTQSSRLPPRKNVQLAKYADHWRTLAARRLRTGRRHRNQAG